LRAGIVRLIGCLFASAACLRGDLVWPTPNPAFARGLPVEAFVQPTVSGRIESALFGCVRNGGSRFHEGLDLKALKRDDRGEALDEIYAILPGRVVYINPVAGHSSYGRYLVVVHDGEAPAFHSLYAHLASIAPGIEAGSRVEAGTVLGRMGRSASYSIPRSRAHLHLELGFRLSDDFQAWYDRQKFGSRNRHGNWNGMNLVGVDPLDFYRAVRRGSVSNFAEYLARLPVAARIRVYAAQAPAFVRNYPKLMTREVRAGESAVAWDIAFTQYGTPLSWTPRFAGEGLPGRPGDVRLLAYNKRLVEGQSCRRVVDLRAGGPSISDGTLVTIRKLFGFR